MPKKQNGGKVLGKGTYGCVVDPAFECKKTPSNKNKVSKLMSDREQLSIDAEIKISKILKKADPDNYYTIYADDSCIIKSNEIDFIDDEKKLCNDVRKGATVANLIMPRGGPQLGEILHNNKFTRKELLKILLHLLYGCRMLLDNHIAHFDLSDRNILMVKDKNNKYRPVMIDFGLFTPTNYKDFKIIINTESKYIWPIEVYARMSTHRNTITPAIRAEIDEYNKNTPFLKFGEKVMVYQLGLIFDTITSPHKTLKSLFRDMRIESPQNRLTIDEAIGKIKALWTDSKTPSEKTTPQTLKRILSPQTTENSSKTSPSDDDLKECVKKCLDAR